MEPANDPLDAQLDELAFLAAYWQKHRGSGRTPQTVKAGLVGAIRSMKLKSPSAVPMDVLQSQKYIDLSFSAKALLIELVAQCKGYNNGQLTARWSDMRLRGWGSDNTLAANITELTEAGFIELSQPGAFGAGGRQSNTYTLTWLDEERNLDQ